MRTITWLLIVCTAIIVQGRPANAQGMFTASVGQLFGGDAASSKGAYALAVGGAGSHGIGSELEFSQSPHFFDAGNASEGGSVLSLMASVSFAVPLSRVRPYGIFGFGFIRERRDSTTGGVFSNLSDDDVGYSAGGGVTLRVARIVGIRADLRHFKVRTSNGLSFQRFLIGVVLGG